MDRVIRSSKWVAAAAFVALLAGSLGFASNMGFKFNAPIVAPTVPPGAPSGDNWLSLPFLNPYTDTEGVCQQLSLTPGGATVAQFDPSGFGTLSTYLCSATPGTPGPGNFTLTKCRAVKIVDGSGSGSGVVVGSHDPAFVCNLLVGTNPAPSGDNWISVPYHTTAVDTQDLCDDVGPDAGTVAEFDPAGFGTLSTYLCTQAGGTGAGNFTLTLGRAAKVVLQTANQPWLPSHY